MTHPSPNHTTIRHAQGSTRSQQNQGIFSLLLGIVGELLITAAIILGLYVVWQLWWTTASVEPERQAQVENFQDSNPTPETEVLPVHRTDPPPAVETVGIGETYAVMHVPVWDWMEIPVAEGTEQWILDQAFAGHYVETQQAGEIGNFAVAAHRRTYGNNFRRVDILQPGDPIVVETKDAYLVYTMDSYEIVQPDQVAVLYPVPNDPDAIPTERIMTMTTCHPEFGNTERYIVYSKLQYWTAKSEGLPEVLRQGSN